MLDHDDVIRPPELPSRRRRDLATPRWTRPLVALFSLTGLLVSGGAAQSQQVPDTSFVAVVATPTYTDRHPRVLFDEGHHNFHTTEAGYAAFATLIRSDGYEVTPGREPFTAASLRGYDVLVIVNALPAPPPGATLPDPNSGRPAFTRGECDAIVNWVSAGGSLLLIADHAPFGNAAENLARRFEVDMSKGYTIDSTHADPEFQNPGCIVYSRENGLLRDHPITRGRDSTEVIKRVIAFTGQSLKIPPRLGGAGFMVLREGAFDLPVTFSEWQNRSGLGRFGTSATGRAQGLTLRKGRGRVVMLGEAGMLSAQLVLRQGRQPLRMGMNHGAIDNRQLAINIMHWLSGLLD
jgi:hypothetical protein